MRFSKQTLCVLHRDQTVHDYHMVQGNSYMHFYLCRICGEGTAAVDDWLRAALQTGIHAGRGEMVLLQSQGSFFAYAPVLKALQRAQLPLAKFLVYPASGEVEGNATLTSELPLRHYFGLPAAGRGGHMCRRRWLHV